jgi:tetratricopeptide (TPR) repeat protein
MKGVMLCVKLACVLLCAAPLVVSAQPTPAEQKIAVASKAIAADASRHQPYAELALALARRARETSDPAWYTAAQVALEQSFALAPDNLQAEQARIWVLLGQHDFAQALERAQALNQRVPDELMTYAFLVDANAELGNYEAAEQAAQWLLDLRPGNVAGLTRAAYLRELFGDVDGALELMRTALQRTPPDEVEDRAWVLTQIAHLELAVGRADAAELALAQALGLFPDYHYALGQLAKVRALQGRLDESVDLLRRRYELAPHPENLFEVGEALKRCARVEEAGQTFAAFERTARAEMHKADNSNRELALYYAEYGANAREALQIAQREIERRSDVHTLDVYAWALYRNGSYTEAETQIARVLQVGVRDADMLYRAGAIAFAANDPTAAASRLTASLTLVPHGPTATLARDLLEQLSARARSAEGG